MPPKKSHILTGRTQTHIIGEYSIDFEVIPTGFELLNGHIMYIMLQNGQSVTSAIKVVRNLQCRGCLVSQISSAKCSGKIQKYAEMY